MTHRNHNEREFEAFLAGEESELARLYRRLPQAEPDAKLDAAVLNLARAAVEPQRVNALRHAKLRNPRPLWLIGLSSAAGVVLAAGVAWQMRHGFDNSPAAGMAPTSARAERDVIPISAITPPAPPPESAPPAPPMLAQPAAAPPAPAAGPAMAALPKATAARPGKSAPAEAASAPADDRKIEVSGQRLRTEAAKPAPPAAETPAPTQASPVIMAEQASSRDGEADAAAAGKDKDRAAAPSPQPFADAAGVPDHNSVERKAAIATGSRRDSFGLSAEEAANGEPLAKQETRRQLSPPAAPQREKSDLAAAAGGAARSAATSAPATSATSDGYSAARTEGQVASTTPPATTDSAPRRAEPEAAATPAPAASTPAPTAATSLGYNNARGERDAALRRNAQLQPAEWINVMQALLREQRRDEAIENRDLFLRRHPGYALPADLRDLR